MLLITYVDVDACNCQIEILAPIFNIEKTYKKLRFWYNKITIMKFKLKYFTIDFKKLLKKSLKKLLSIIII